jgi:hypothetical protein
MTGAQKNPSRINANISTMRYLRVKMFKDKEKILLAARKNEFNNIQNQQLTSHWEKKGQKQ